MPTYLPPSTINRATYPTPLPPILGAAYTTPNQYVSIVICLSRTPGTGSRAGGYFSTNPANQQKLPLQATTRHRDDPQRNDNRQASALQGYPPQAILRRPGGPRQDSPPGYPHLNIHSNTKATVHLSQSTKKVLIMSLHSHAQRNALVDN